MRSSDPTPVSPTPPPAAAPADCSGGTALLHGARLALVVGVLALGLCWSHWTTLKAMEDRWSHDPQYSHGYLVPLFALVVLWQWRKQCPSRGLQANWGGLSLLLLGAGMRLTAAHLYIEPLDNGSLLFTLAGLVWLVFGWPTLRWSWPALAFLVFMLPLPFQVEGLLAQPLRRMATTASTYLLQTLGYPALADGNHILIGDVRLGVADACSGLGMLMTFFALTTAAAMILRPSWWERTLMVASAVPIALIANVARIAITGMVHVAYGSEAGRWVHDHAGWLMMPFALALLWLELWYVRCLWPEREAAQPLALNFQPTVPALPYPRKPGGAPVPPVAPVVPGPRAAASRTGHDPRSTTAETSNHDSLSETR